LKGSGLTDIKLQQSEQGDFMNRRFAHAGSILLMIACSVSLAPAQFVHPDLKSGKIVVRKALILPPRVSVTKSGMKGNETLMAESSTIEAALPAIIAEVVREKGCTVLNNAFAPEALEKTQDLKFALADIQDRFDALHKHLSEKPKDVRNGRFTLGDEVVNFNPGAAADALVFVRGAGVVNTGGKKVLGAIAGVNETDYILIDVAIVDSQSGAVLYYGWSVTGGNYIEQPERMKKPIDASLKEWKVGKQK
jgi:hypothetical protein